ncbi:GNAT family N-acetyltransferase [Candidatus Woesearchaeota archaeon]|nr:GNAT family N-acetyltransferase [Candidatus Woesearchaeota archaeon]
MAKEVKLVTDPDEIKSLYEFIKKFPYDYPDYLMWVEKCYRELQLGYKKAFVCKADEVIVANLVFQKHKDDSSSLELKNGRVDGGYQRKKIFSSLYNAAEAYAKENGYSRIVCDTHKDNKPVIATLKKLGFEEEAQESLYQNDKLEAVLSKKLK